MYQRIVVVTDQEEKARQALAVLQKHFSWIECLVFKATPNMEEVVAFAERHKPENFGTLAVIDSRELNIAECADALRCRKVVHVSADNIDALMGHLIPTT